LAKKFQASGPELERLIDGVQITELLPDDAAVARNSSTTRRFAIAYVWSDPDRFWATHRGKDGAGNASLHGYTAPYAHGQGLCILAGSALNAKNLYQKAIGSKGVVDAVVVTDNLSHGDQKDLAALGIHVFLTNFTNLYTVERYAPKVASGYGDDSHASRLDAYFKLRAASLKAVIAGLTNYERVLYMDADAFAHAQPSPDVFETGGSAEYVVGGPCCINAPLGVGIFLLRPNLDAFRSMVGMVRSGFTHEHGWGQLHLKVGGRWPGILCRPGEEYTRAYCEDPDTPRWDFLGAESDKGLLFAEYKLVRKSFHSVLHKIIRKANPVTNICGALKPWTNQSGCRPPNTHVRIAFWRVWEGGASPALRQGAATAFGKQCLDIMHALHGMPVLEMLGNDTYHCRASNVTFQYP